VGGGMQGKDTGRVKDEVGKLMGASKAEE